jgi:alpha-D-xyloside xylohydrolase
MPAIFEIARDGGSLLCHFEGETVLIEPWGPDSARVRATHEGPIRDDMISALLPLGDDRSAVSIWIADEGDGIVRNGEFEVRATPSGVLAFSNARTGELLLREKAIHKLSVPARSYSSPQGELLHTVASFEAYDGEHFYGLGQHQHGRLDQKGSVIDLVQRNTEVSIPFLLSSRGYGFLWNNAAIGRVELGSTGTRWVAEATLQIDYWVTAGRTPAAILANYARATGNAPNLPEWATGYWQSKLRYASQDELLATAREYRERGLPLSVIVIDFFHWTRQGEWRFDPEQWPDPAAMVAELRDLGVQPVVSVWPTVSRLADTWPEMWSSGFIIRNLRGAAGQMYFVDNGSTDGLYMHYYDSTNPDARKFIWERVREGYVRYGIDAFWLDACEPEIVPLSPDNLRFHAGTGLAVANIYPRDHARAFFDGLRSEGVDDVFLLCRSAWAGSQAFGAALWSADIESTWEAFRSQIPAGLNASLSGIPWWTHDIGGFRGGDPSTVEFRELLVRWFQFGAFSPLFRMHGHRQPVVDDFAGGPNEVWSYGDEAYDILRSYMELRERLRPAISGWMREAHERGIPPMRPLFLEFPDDPAAYDVADQYLFGPDLLVAPVTELGARCRSVYLPAGAEWTNAWTGAAHEGGQVIEVDAPLEQIPLFLRDGAKLPIVSQQAV